MRSLIVSAVALFALGQVAEAHQQSGVTEVRVSRNLAIEDTSAVLAQFPQGSEAPTFTVCWRRGSGTPPCDSGSWAGLESGECSAYVVVDPRALPLQATEDFIASNQDDDGGPEFFIDSVHTDGQPMGFENGLQFVGANGETLRVVESVTQQDRFGCWVGLDLRYGEDLSVFYRRR